MKYISLKRESFTAQVLGPALSDSILVGKVPAIGQIKPALQKAHDRNRSDVRLQAIALQPPAEGDIHQTLRPEIAVASRNPARREEPIPLEWAFVPGPTD